MNKTQATKIIAAHWIPPKPGETGNAQLHVTTENADLVLREFTYAVAVLTADDGTTVTAISLTRGKKQYWVNVASADWSCDCGDFTFRRQYHDRAGCKHIQGLRQVLKAK